MSQSLQEIITSYKNYGFEMKQEGDSYMCFLYKKGRYFGVDILQLLEDEDSCAQVRIKHDYYSGQGYAVNIKNVNEIEDLEDELFKSFFSYEITLQRLRRKFDDFVNKQTKNLLGSQYVYIESPYEMFDGRTESTDDGLLNGITRILSKKSPQLIIIEAAAGYGKTCAAYEILKQLVSSNDEIISPLFTELSKNRSARIFRYILLDEIDVEFPTLNSDLVIHEIKKGRIPLIIDGFDELIEKFNASDIDLSNAFEDVETMLNTLGQLLEGNAKIILTTRKTALFSGIEFDKWLQSWNNKFEVTRFSLKEPRVKDWLGQGRFQMIKEYNVPIQYIANPVILTYLRNINDENFTQQIQNPDLLVKQYFEKMLEREKERQNLIITVDKQYEIFKNVAKLLLEFDITVESKEFFKEIIKDQNFKLLEYTRTLYTGQDKPTLENLVDTLATHALLDRKGRDGSQIGFINDFVLGILVGEIICESSIEKIEKDYSYYMLELACTAYKVQNMTNKTLLWEKVDKVSHKLQPVSVFTYDITLREQLVRDYKELSIYGTTYFNIFFTSHRISNTAFLSCYFKNCTFDVSCLSGIGFVDCTFDGCKVTEGKYLDETKEISTVKCTLKDCSILENYVYPVPDSDKVFTDFEIDIIRKIWNISGTRSHHILLILREYEKNMHRQVNKSLESLEQRGFIQINGSHVYFNINKLEIIKSNI